MLPLIVLPLKTPATDSGKWPFHTPPIHTPTKCRPKYGENLALSLGQSGGTNPVLGTFPGSSQEQPDQNNFVNYAGWPRNRNGTGTLGVLSHHLECEMKSPHLRVRRFLVDLGRHLASF